MRISKWETAHEHAPDWARLGVPSHWASQGPLVRGVESAPLLFDPWLNGRSPVKTTMKAKPLPANRTPNHFVWIPQLCPSLVLAVLLGCALLHTGCKPVEYRVGPNGVTVSTFGGPTKLAPGTKLQPIEEVTRGNWRYEVKEGQYNGLYVVLSDKDVVN